MLWRAVVRRPNNEALRLHRRFDFIDAWQRAGAYVRDDLVLEYAPRLVRTPLDPDRTKLSDPKVTFNVPGYDIVSSDGSLNLKATVSDATLEPELLTAARRYESLKRTSSDTAQVDAARQEVDRVLGRMAEASRSQANQALSLLQQRSAVEVAGDSERWSLENPGGVSTPVLSYRSELAANDAAKAFNAWRERQPARLGFRLLAPLLGFVLGAAGYAVVWNRARRTPEVIARGGIARTFQNIRLFHNMTVLENVLVGLDRHFVSGILSMVLRSPAARLEERERVQEARQLLEFVGLADRVDDLAKNLPYGGQRRLEIARALASRPSLLLLDEPAAGMNPAESAELMELIRAIRDRGVTVLLIEHHMKLVMGISDRIAVLEYGEKIAEGTPEEIRRNPRVIEAYLGKDND
jgi:ABC-type branched-subunit amino acid transport system ATPase component